MIVQDLLDRISHIKFIGDNSREITEVCSLLNQTSHSTSLAWCSPKNAELLKINSEGTFIVAPGMDPSFYSKRASYIIVENPRRAFQETLALFFVESPHYEVAASAKIHASVIMGDEVCIGENVVIEKECKIGNRVVIGHNTVILKGTIIQDNVTIGSNNTIGGVGFGYEKNDEGQYCVIPHIGNVLIEEHVDIGNNTCIDRAVLGSTCLRRNSKIDNLVHIAHGVEIGENSVVIANAMVAGSVKIGRDCWIAPSSSILNKVNLGNEVVIGLGAVVLKSVEDKTVIIGNPGRPLEKKVR